LGLLDPDSDGVPDRPQQSSLELPNALPVKP